jgi:hypothetical protein
VARHSFEIGASHVKGVKSKGGFRKTPLDDSFLDDYSEPVICLHTLHRLSRAA